MGDIDVQSIAGAFFTGTHGTGVAHQILSSLLVGVTIITADGEIREWHETTHPDEMNAVRVSFGALGIVAKMAVRVLPSYKLEEKQYKRPLAEVMANLETHKRSHRHFEFFWFPKTDYVVVKELNETERPPVAPQPFMVFIEAKLFSQLARWSASAPAVGKWLNRAIVSLVDAETEGTVDHAHRVYPSPRELRFNEMEYSIPAESWPDCFAEIVERYNQPDFPVLFPIECRWVKGDDIWLSPANGRDSAYIAVHQVAGHEYKEPFAQIEAIFRRYNGRPHWGKLNTMSREDAWETYPKMADFASLRAKLDPHKMFCNEYVARMVG
ncbi:MAG: FAD-binding oxidoreductase, partial [Sphaerospermopsis sp. SIO1G2]|nr:FAD-binding oxidoreductase [Sphaerospermopsis sp. SIO1G2]